MTKEEMTALLGRPLSPTEDANFDLYLDIAKSMLKEVLCYGTCPEVDTRTFKAREGYSTVFTGAFTYVSSVTVNGKETTTYTPYLWDNPDAKWFNSIVFQCAFKRNDTVTVTAQWGFNGLPSDLKLLLSKYFGVASSGAKNETTIQSKRVEDYQIVYGNLDQSKTDQIAGANANTIRKYSLCGVGNIQHGGC